MVREVSTLLIQFNSFLPVLLIDLAALIIAIVVAVFLVYKLKAWLNVIPTELKRDAKQYIGTVGLVKLLLSEVFNRVIAQRNLITDSRTRLVIHLLVFWGFVLLAVATVWDDIFFRNGVLPPPFTTANPGNLIGNAGGLLVLVGTAGMIVRYSVDKKYKSHAKGDLVFLVTLFIATVTGFLTEGSRFFSVQLAYYNYAIHLAVVAVLLATAPFTHFFHAVLTPLMRYFGRIEMELKVRGISTYPYYRKLRMAMLAERIRAKDEKPTSPDWLVKRSGIETRLKLDEKENMS